MATAIPMPMPTSKSVKTIAKTVAKKGTKSRIPFFAYAMNWAGFANLYPTTNNIAAKLDNGIKLSKLGIARTDTSNRIPCRMADNLVRPPLMIFAELRTMTWVTGSPPNNPETIFPAPCATNSRLVGVTRLSGSILSVASTHNNVSSEATIAIVAPKIQTSPRNKPPKSGVAIISLNPFVNSGI